MSRRNLTFLVGGLVVALVLAGGLSYYASSQPDGLDKVVTGKGLDRGASHHDLSEAPLAGYDTSGVHDRRLSVGVAGVVGVLVTFVLGAALVYGVRRRVDDPGPGRDRQEH